ncbi:M48 family metallopeptidase [Castellaniella defragrans]|uniref:Putative Zn-dependent protease n=1 Tax=Castellaniella defragrans TaxID=75697 RepID=A0A7W9TPG1_CASDE|nr:M48 family metallopeptidase [Castellaniella defragrans]MBB6084299.1 putative Zn-dependent protease [Castellaniella defragrans]
MIRAIRNLSVMGLAALLAACAQVQTTQSGVVGVNRTQTMSTLVSEAELNQQAEVEYRQILAQARAKGALDTPAAQTQRVQAISRKLIAQVGVFRPDARNWAWEIHLLKSDEVNAWCMPGGKIAVYTGLLDKIQPTDAELAAVLGHEISHALREHAREQVSRQMAANVGLSILSAVTGNQAVADLGSSLTQVMFTLPNSRSNETEADRMGVELAARAGYDPRAAITLWQKMERSGGGGQPEILSTHPSSQSRIADLQQASGIVLPLYQGKK